MRKTLTTLIAMMVLSISSIALAHHTEDSVTMIDALEHHSQDSVKTIDALSHHSQSQDPVIMTEAQKDSAVAK